MAQRVVVAEAKKNKSGQPAAERGMHNHTTARLRLVSSPTVMRMPPQYSTHDVEVMLNLLWGMFSESQSERLIVSVPWDDSETPCQMSLKDLAATLEDWLE